MKKQILISLGVIVFLFAATTLVILYGKGYRFWFSQGKPDISGTGLLVTTSKPDGAQVFINDHVTTATDSTINLAPDIYTVRIFKDGYFPWQKKIQIQNEIVAKADATLFPTAPKLESITASGAQNPTLDPSGTRIAYTTASASARKKGLFVLDMTSRSLLPLQSSSTQIADDTVDIFSGSLVSWSPDGKQLLASISATTYLLDASNLNQNPTDVTTTLQTLLDEWKTLGQEKELAKEQSLKETLKKMVIANFANTKWSPDETKILYTASQSATIPIIIKPPLIGTNQTKESRKLEKGSVYVYDIKEDKNYKINTSVCHPGVAATVLEGTDRIGSTQKDSIATSQMPRGVLQNDNTCNNPLSWYPDSKHLIYVHDKKIEVLDYDDTNQLTVYAGPFLDNYVFPFPNDSKIVILTNLGNPDIQPNLYTLELK